jgi:hypothetical protein
MDPCPICGLRMPHMHERLTRNALDERLAHLLLRATNLRFYPWLSEIDP